MCDVVECCDILACLFCCVHYYVGVLPVHLGGISGDVENRDNVDQGLLLVVLCGNQLVDLFLNAADILSCGCFF